MWCLRSALRISFTAILVVSLLLAVVFLLQIDKRGKPASVSLRSEHITDFDTEPPGFTMTSTPSSISASTLQPVARDMLTTIIESPQQTTPSPESSKRERRKSLLIFGADRSGTTFISRMFSEDPRVFMVYEPLWITKYWKKELEGNWTNSELEVISGILSCKFADFPRATQFLAHTSRNWAGAPFKNPFQSPNFCNVTESGKTCPDLSSVPKFAEHVCSTKFKHSVTKVGQVRAPERKLEKLVPKIFQENPDTDIRVLQILRDPRGSLDSRIKLGWMPRHTSPNFLSSVRDPCQKTAENVKYGRNLPEKYKNRYLEVYYRDIAFSPVKTAQKIYSFVGFEMSEELIKWIVFSTNPTEEVLARESKKTFSSVRNSTANVDKWRQSAPKEQVRIIERECSELMQLMGLKDNGH